MRTKPLSLLRSKTSEINRYVTLSLFLNNQFFVDYGNKIDEKGEKLTSDIFEENDFSSRHNVRLDDLVENKEYYKNYLFSSSFVFLYSAFDVYLQSLADYVNKVTEKQIVIDDKFHVNRIFWNFDSKLRKEIGEEESETRRYINLRRNSHVHGDGSPSGELKTIIRYKGSKLNNYWENKEELDLSGLDFGSMETKYFDFDELIDIIRIIRRISDKIDKSVINLVGEKKILDYLKERFSKKFSSRMSQYPESKIKKKLSGFIEREAGIPRQEVNLDVSGICGT